jgi:hypothetical protein
LACAGASHAIVFTIAIQSCSKVCTCTCLPKPLYVSAQQRSISVAARILGQIRSPHTPQLDSADCWLQQFECKFGSFSIDAERHRKPRHGIASRDTASQAETRHRKPRHGIASRDSASQAETRHRKPRHGVASRNTASQAETRHRKPIHGIASRITASQAETRHMSHILKAENIIACSG